MIIVAKTWVHNDFIHVQERDIWGGKGCIFSVQSEDRHACPEKPFKSTHKIIERSVWSNSSWDSKTPYVEDVS